MAHNCGDELPNFNVRERNMSSQWSSLILNQVLFFRDMSTLRCNRRYVSTTLDIPRVPWEQPPFKLLNLYFVQWDKGVRDYLALKSKFLENNRILVDRMVLI